MYFIKCNLWYDFGSGNWCLVLSFPSYLMRTRVFSNTTRIQCYHLHCLQWQTVNHKKDTTCWLLHCYFYGTMIAAVSCIDYFFDFMTYRCNATALQWICFSNRKTSLFETCDVIKGKTNKTDKYLHILSVLSIFRGLLKSHVSNRHRKWETVSGIFHLLPTM